MCVCVSTCRSEDDVTDVSVQCLHPLHDDLCVVDVFGDEEWSVADGLDRVLHEWVVLDKLEPSVRQVERAGDVLLSHHVVDALMELIKKI